jgi:tetratricopeptide (TPR) repeat protein
VRQADLLETRASDPGAALDQILKACRIDPLNGDLLDRADALANRLGAHLERAWIAERRVQAAGDDETRARQLMRHAEIADLGLKDREQAIRSLTKALTLSEHSPQVAAEIEDVARNLDRARPELGRGDAMRSLIRAHIELAQRLGEPFGPLLVLRASQLLRSDLEDESACFDVLKQGATLFPDDLDLYDALERSALQIKRLDALDAHLSRAIQRSNDAELRLGLLQRRGNLLGQHLKRYGKAAEVFRELLSLAPNDEGARRALPDMLRRDGRYQDLLRLYDEWLVRTSDPSQRVELMREKAKLWELELRNRSGAIEVWREVLELSPDDSEASAMLARLHAP